jgi:hypothetical protein
MHGCRGKLLHLVYLNGLSVHTFTRRASVSHNCHISLVLRPARITVVFSKTFWPVAGPPGPPARRDVVGGPATAGGDAPVSEGTHVAGPVSLRTSMPGNHIDAGDLSLTGWASTLLPPTLIEHRTGASLHAWALPVFRPTRLRICAEQAGGAAPGTGRGSAPSESSLPFTP